MSGDIDPNPSAELVALAMIRGDGVLYSAHEYVQVIAKLLDENVGLRGKVSTVRNDLEAAYERLHQ